MCWLEVASHVGAWIETLPSSSPASGINVASHVGAWIETQRTQYKNVAVESHPMWVRGLKRELPAPGLGLGIVASHVGAWIETLPV